MTMLTVMPDYFSAYAWVKWQDDDTTLVGGNIADGPDGFEYSPFKVSRELQADFFAWAGEFDGHESIPGFNWPDFHRRGFDLARRLKREIGDAARVIYAKPAEDPGYVWEDRWEIMADGPIVPIKVVKYCPID